MRKVYLTEREFECILFRLRLCGTKESTRLTARLAKAERIA